MPQRSIHFHWMTLEAISVEPHSDTQPKTRTRKKFSRSLPVFFCAFLAKSFFLGGRQVRFIVAGRFDLRILRGLHAKSRHSTETEESKLAAPYSSEPMFLPFHQKGLLFSEWDIFKETCASNFIVRGASNLATRATIDSRPCQAHLQVLMETPSRLWKQTPWWTCQRRTSNKPVV